VLVVAQEDGVDAAQLLGRDGGAEELVAAGAETEIVVLARRVERRIGEQAQLADLDEQGGRADVGQPESCGHSSPSSVGESSGSSRGGAPGSQP
jgi:hypothetical protein